MALYDPENVQHQRWQEQFRAIWTPEREAAFKRERDRKAVTS